MNKKSLRTNLSGRSSRRDFMRLSGASLALAMSARYGLPALAQSGDIPPR